MKIVQRLTSWGRRFTDAIIDVLSGQRPASGLDGPGGFYLALTIGVMSLGIGGFVIWSSLHRIGEVAVNTTANDNANVQTAGVDLEKLQGQDTDEDGLSDYAELFNLKTSPYLKDSDSDGIDDAAESTQGTNPNCPEGAQCTGLVVGTVVNANDELSPEFLRQALLTAGVAQSVLDGVPDEQLFSIYQEIVAQSGGVARRTTPTLTDLQGLSGSDIRKLLVDSGVPASELVLYDDETLKEIFQQAIQQ